MHADFEFYGATYGLSACCVYGGSPYRPQEMALRKGVDIVVGTPGRVKVTDFSLLIFPAQWNVSSILLFLICAALLPCSGFHCKRNSQFEVFEIPCPR